MSHIMNRKAKNFSVCNVALLIQSCDFRAFKLYSCFPVCLSLSVLDCRPSFSRNPSSACEVHAVHTLRNTLLCKNQDANTFSKGWTADFGVCSHSSLIFLFDLHFVIQLLSSAHKKSGFLVSWKKWQLLHILDKYHSPHLTLNRVEKQSLMHFFLPLTDTVMWL